MYVDNQILPREKEFHIVDDQNHDVPVQLVQSRAEGNYWALWADDVPALGYRTYRIVVGQAAQEPARPFVPGIAASMTISDTGSSAKVSRK